MDISKADKMKLEFRVMLWYLRRHLKKNYKITFKEIEEDLENCGNPVIAEVWHIIKNGANQIKEDYQKKIILEFPMALLWIIYRDTAYMPISINFLKQILDKKEELYPDVMKYYIELKDCYCNAWHDTKEHTAELKEDGKIPDIQGFMGGSEHIFVPSSQYEVHKPIIKKIQEDMDKEIKLKKQNKNYGREEEDANSKTNKK